MSRFISVIFSAAALCFSSACWSDADIEKDAKNISPRLYKAETFGKWGDWDAPGTPFGYIRYLIYEGGIEETNDVLVIQWVLVSHTEDNDDDSKLIASAVITKTGIIRGPIKITEKPYILHLSIDSPVCHETQLSEIKITGVGKYEFKTLNKKPCDGA